MLEKLDNGELIQIDLHHEEKEGEIVRHATVYGVGFKLRRGSREAKEAREAAEVILSMFLCDKIGNIEVITD
jgi:hypothetical protein